MHKLVIVAFGAFGAAVADRLRGPKTWVWQGEPAELDLSRLPYADTYVMIAGHPCPQLEAQLCQAVLNWRCRFIPLVHEHPYLRSGPVTHVGALACSACYDRRIHQHTASTKVSDRMAEEYQQRGDAVLPQGIIPLWADIASGLVKLRIEEIPTAGAPEKQQMLGIDLISGGVIRTEVIGVDNCPLCDRKNTDPLDRSIANLPTALFAGMPGAQHATK